ncbi:X-ray repair cross-complementing protein 5-like [Planococcus citri]|uniref:X-ray repair cross-complementing protein 5-like n=1 Tax=Planococcus citri TaxID=170843 RepID=UPI0031F9FFCC
MGSRKEKEVIAMLLDIGRNMKKLYDSQKTYLESSKECISRIVERKLFSESVDELALIVFGSEKTNNRLASQNGGYENIDVLSAHLSVASWDLLKYVKDLETSSVTADWMDALLVAADYIKNETENRVFSKYKIVVFSNFDSVVDEFKFESVIQALNDKTIELVVIGPDVQQEENTPGEQKSESQVDGEILISNVVDKVEGSLICSFSDALGELMHVQRRSVKPTPWNALFTISSKIKIPISAFKKTDDIKPMKWTSKAVDDPNAGVIRERAHMKYDKQNDVEVEVPQEETVRGFLFGSTVIPFGESEESMGYKSGPKGLYLIGCTSQQRVPLHLLTSKYCYIVVAKLGDDVANKALNAFIEGLKEQGSVGIARRVYSENSSAAVGALFPVITEEHRYLVYSELPFAEDEHIFKFHSLSNVDLSEEQLRAVDDLIDGMDLDETEEHSELYELTSIYDPREQHVLRCITEKAIHPDRPLDDDLSSADVIKPLPQIIKVVEPTLKRIKDLFPLQLVEPKKKKFKNFSSDDSKPLNGDVKPDVASSSSAIKIDPDNAAEEFTALLNENKPLREVNEQMQIIIEKLVSNSNDNGQIIKALKAFRDSCISKDFKSYNECITNVKNIVVENENSALWELIEKETLGLIPKSEADSSDVTTEAAEEFMRIPSKETDSLGYGSLDTGTGSTMDLLDEL